MTLTGLKLGMIGGGAMAEALVAGLTKAGLVQSGNIRVSDISAERRSFLSEKYQVEIATNNGEVVANTDVIVLAIKPFVMGEVLSEIGNNIGANQVVISIAAGITTAYIENKLVEKVPVVRAIPNTPALIGAGAAAVCPGRWATEEHVKLALAMFGAVGQAVPVAEKLMDAVTGLSGSGPAYMYTIAEALSDAGVRAGLSRDVALTLTVQTMLGAARMVLETKQHPSVLKDMVTTPGGTTAEGLFALEEAGLRVALGRAVEMATVRSRQLSGEDK